LELGFVAGNQGVALEVAGFEALQPIADEGADMVDTKLFVEVGIFLEICVSEFKQRSRGAKAIFLQMNERAGELNQSFVEGIIWAGAVGEPQFFQDVVCLEIEPAIEAFEISEIMGIKIASFELLDQFCDGSTLFAHVSATH
jgi:hypothetical protein